MLLLKINMCIIGLVLHKDRIIIASNRDEFGNRESKEMHWWMDEDLLAGKDMKGGGTWLGITKSGRFTCILNV